MPHSSDFPTASRVRLRSSASATPSRVTLERPGTPALGPGAGRRRLRGARPPGLGHRPCHRPDDDFYLRRQWGPGRDRQRIVFGGSVGSGSRVIPRSASDVGQTTSAESPLAKVEIASLRQKRLRSQIQGLVSFHRNVYAIWRSCRLSVSPRPWY